VTDTEAINAVRALRPDLALPRAGDLDTARTALLAATRQDGRRLAPVRARRSYAWTAGGALVLVIVIAAVLLLLPADRLGVGTSSAAADPVVVLHQAAAVTQSEPDLVPSAGQFYYIQYGDYQGWFSMDGTHDGAVRPRTNARLGAIAGCRNGVQADVGKSGQVAPSTHPCSPDPAYFADAPITSAAWLRYLAATYGTDSNTIGKGILSLLEFHYLRPTARAALFDAAARVAGSHVVGDGTTGLAPHTVGITWTSSADPKKDVAAGLVAILVFDEARHTFLGYDLIGAGRTVASDRATQVGIVNQVGQRP
jgi:hypothetical protein